MMKNRFLTAAMGMLFLVATLGVAHAALVLDFRTGTGTPEGGTIFFDGTNSWGTGIPVNSLQVSGLTGPFAGLNGAHDLSGTFVLPSDPNGAAVMTYNTDTVVHAGVPARSISITGDVPDFGVPSGTLLSGTISTYTPVSFGGGFLAALGGPDTKNAALLSDIGLPPNQPFMFLGSTISASLTSTVTPGLMSGPAISTDIANTAVPIPTSIFLLGSGLLGLMGIGRRFRK